MPGHLILGAALIACVCGLCPEAPAQEPGVAGSPKNSRLAFISDTQTPLWLEALVLGGHRNVEATDTLLAHILRTRPASLFMLGDLVSFGAYTGSWQTMEQNILYMRKTQIPVHAILGNHELMIYARTGESFFADMFPDHVRTGYCVSVDSVAVLLLNSNFDNLDEAEQQQQQQWYTQTLDSLEQDPGTVSIVVCCHHSPFTNSTIVEASGPVRQMFVPPYIRTAKCLLFLSGHAHAFEHFREQGKDFMVIGGGGGSRHVLLTGAEEIWKDRAPDKKPLFHYLTVDRRGASLRATVHGLRADFHNVEETYVLDVPASQPIRN